MPFVVGVEKLIAARPEIVIEAASHEAVREHAETLLSSGIAVIVLSGGALCDDSLRERLERASKERRAPLYVPSGGIGGLDALKAACAAGVDEVSIAVTKPPAAWKGIPYVERLRIDLDRLPGPVTLFEGTAREGVPHFPANVNIAAILRANARHPSSLVAQRQHRVEQLGVVPRHVDRVPPQPRALRIAQPLAVKLDEDSFLAGIKSTARGRRDRRASQRETPRKDPRSSRPRSVFPTDPPVDLDQVGAGPSTFR